MITTSKRPGEKESNEYFRKYIQLVPNDNFLEMLENSTIQTTAFLKTLDDAQWNYRYADGKWSVKEVWLHVIDTERVMAYRALRFARNDKTPLPGFEQDDYTPFTDAENRSPESILREFNAVRNATLELFRNFNNEMLDRLGTANGSPFTPRALGFVIAGHEIHHLNIIKERYL